MVDRTERVRGTPAAAARVGFVSGAVVPALFGLAAVILDGRALLRGGIDGMALTILGAVVAVCGLCGAAAASFSSWVAGPTYSARWLGIVSVGAMFGGAVFGSGLNHWNRPQWHVWFSLGGGAVAGVLVLALLVRREQRMDRQSRDDRRPAAAGCSNGHGTT